MLVFGSSMKKTRLNPISAKTKARNARWAVIKKERIERSVKWLGYATCEWCGGEFAELDAHHKDWQQITKYHTLS